MKRGVLIATGTLGGLGAVLAITPPQFGSGALGTSTIGNGATQAANASASTPATAAPASTAQATPAATKKATAKATKKATAKATKKATTKATPKATATKTAAAPTTTPTPTTKTVSGTFSGETVQTQFGPVQVQITISNGKITAAKALQAPSGSFRTQQITAQAVPYLIDETLQAQSANIQGVGGASYTSYGWQQSLASALAKAGL